MPTPRFELQRQSHSPEGLNALPTASKNTAIAWEIRRALNPFRESQSRREETQFYRRLIPKDGGCIIDVGANGGSKTEIFRTLAARVIAIEPDPVSAGLLRKRFPWRPSVIVRQCAVADKPGTISFFVAWPFIAHAQRAGKDKEEDNQRNL